MTAPARPLLAGVPADGVKRTYHPVSELVAGQWLEAPLLELRWKVDRGRPPIRRAPPALGRHAAEFRARCGG